MHFDIKVWKAWASHPSPASVFQGLGSSPEKESSSLASVQACRTCDNTTDLGCNAGRTPLLSLLTLLPLLLTEPSVLTFAALLVLLPGDRSHQFAHTTESPKSLLLLKPAFVTVYPPAQQIHTLARQ